MDPDANLAETMSLAETLQEQLEMESVFDMCDVDVTQLESDVNRLTDLVTAMNEWLSKGGALPKAWQR